MSHETFPARTYLRQMTVLPIAVAAAAFAGFSLLAPLVRKRADEKAAYSKRKRTTAHGPVVLPDGVKETAARLLATAEPERIGKRAARRNRHKQAALLEATASVASSQVT